MLLLCASRFGGTKF